jgi:hypothetical protein
MCNIGATLLSLALVLSWLTPNSAPVPDTAFDMYGTISWEDEKSRLDNFAIQLQHWENMIGYIVVVEAVGGCPGEAQARAIRAKKYVVEHRGTPTNRVIWKVKGYREELMTTLVLAPPEIIMSYEYSPTISGKAGPLNKSCRLELARIKKSKW